MKINIDGRELEIKFVYSREKGEDGTIRPRDTYAAIYEGPKLVAEGWAMLHPLDVDKFTYKKGRKIALAQAVKALYPPKDGHRDPSVSKDRQFFWMQVWNLVK